MFIAVLKTCSFDSFIRKYIQRIVSRDFSTHTFLLNAEIATPTPCQRTQFEKSFLPTGSVKEFCNLSLTGL